MFMCICYGNESVHFFCQKVIDNWNIPIFRLRESPLSLFPMEQPFRAHGIKGNREDVLLSTASSKASTSTISGQTSTVFLQFPKPKAQTSSSAVFLFLLLHPIKTKGSSTVFLFLLFLLSSTSGDLSLVFLLLFLLRLPLFHPRLDHRGCGICVARRSLAFLAQPRVENHHRLLLLLLRLFFVFLHDDTLQVSLGSTRSPSRSRLFRERWTPLPHLSRIFQLL